MIKEGMFYKPSMNNSQEIDEVLILVTDVKCGKYVCGVNILNQCEDFEYDEDDNMGEPFEYYYEPATNGDVIKAMFKPNRITRTEDDIVHIDYDFTTEWWNAPYKGK